MSSGEGEQDAGVKAVARAGAVPALAAALALGYLVAAFAGALALAAVVVVASVAACALVLSRRPSGSLRLVLAAIGGWLAIGIGGAWLLRHEPAGGLMWTVTVIFLLPLPIVPWLYARTFGSPAAGENEPHEGGPR